MTSKSAPRSLAALIGDVVGSRSAGNRQAVHDALSTALSAVNAEVDTVDVLQVSAGDEFHGTFPTVGEALYAGLLLRLRLDPEVDIRLGVAWGGVEVLDARNGTQDGPAWWAARAAIDWVKQQQSTAGWQSVRTAYRLADDGAPGAGRTGVARNVGPSHDAVNAALLCQDHLLGLMDERSRHILEGLMHGRTQARIAEELGLTRQAVNQRRKHDGIAVMAAAAESLRKVR